MASKSKYPVKTSINLAQKQTHTRRILTVFLSVAVTVGLSVLFYEYGIIYVLANLRQTKALADQQAAITAQLTERTSNYNNTLQNYRIETSTLTQYNGLSDPMDCLLLIETELLNKAQVSSFTVNNEAITVKLSGVTLDDISAIYLRLTANKLVSGVRVYTAVTNQKSQPSSPAAKQDDASTESPAENQSVTATMTILLAKKDVTAPTVKGAAS